MKQNAPLIYWAYKQVDVLIARAHLGDKSFQLGDEQWSFNLYLPLLKERFDTPTAKFVGQVKCPVLILHGKLDHNIPYTEADQTHQALMQAGDIHVAAHVFEGLDHSFRRLGNDDEDFVTAMQRSLDPAMPEVLTNWLKTFVR